MNLFLNKNTSKRARIVMLSYAKAKLIVLAEINLRFQSYVILDGIKTDKMAQKLKDAFQSYVILYTIFLIVFYDMLF